MTNASVGIVNKNFENITKFAKCEGLFENIFEIDDH